MPKRILLADDSLTIQKVVELTFTEGAVERPDAMRQSRSERYEFIQTLITERGLKAELRQDSFVTGKLEKISVTGPLIMASVLAGVSPWRPTRKSVRMMTPTVTAIA